MDESMDELIQRATEIGLSRGWNHANHVEAYGGDMYEEPQVPDGFQAVATYFIAAHAEGVERYENNQYADGSYCGN